LDGDVTPQESGRIAHAVKVAKRHGASMPPLPHGGHRCGTGWGKTEPGVGEEEVIDWVRAIIDNPTDVRRAPRNAGFVVVGSQGTRGEVIVLPSGENAWYIGTAYPKRLK
jgi:hypothetical protein